MAKKCVHHSPIKSHVQRKCEWQWQVGQIIVDNALQIPWIALITTEKWFEFRFANICAINIVQLFSKYTFHFWVSADETRKLFAAKHTFIWSECECWLSVPSSFLVICINTDNELIVGCLLIIAKVCYGFAIYYSKSRQKRIY